MNIMKLRVLDQFKTPMALQNPDDIQIIFPYHTGTLTKSLKKGSVKILNASQGEIEVSISDFELDGMPEGEHQTFKMEISYGKTRKLVRFTRGLSIHTMESKGVKKKVLGKRE